MIADVFIGSSWRHVLGEVEWCANVSHNDNTLKANAALLGGATWGCYFVESQIEPGDRHVMVNMLCLFNLRSHRPFQVMQSPRGDLDPPLLSIISAIIISDGHVRWVSECRSTPLLSKYII